MATMMERLGSLEDEAGRRKDRMPGFFKNYDARVDQDIMALMLNRFCENIARSEWPESLANAYDKYDGDMAAFAADAYKKSFLVNPERNGRSAR